MQRSLLLGMRWSLELMRSTSTMTKLHIIGAELEKQSNDCVLIEYSKGVSEDAHRIHVPLVWLRDHSRDSSSYNWNTNQRRCDLTGIFERRMPYATIQMNAYYEYDGMTE
ncbi:unnamed protein product [Toxocara canis]|uniref:Ig-like domain-containing protein n=1 Tax=Toxocara canis TaxID=6265 RepID=A0A183VF74_TOXCA|nr:unnamed protein product [Toxocara canis]